MSGYVFHCTPCGKAHAGECPPRAEPTKPKPWEVEIEVGSRWRCQRWLLAYKAWGHVGPMVGFEVMSIITNGNVERTAIQLREWGQPMQPVATVSVKLWGEDGHDDGCGYLKRMVAW